MEAEQKPDEAQQTGRAPHKGGTAAPHVSTDKQIEKISHAIESRHAENNKKKRRMWWIKTILLLVLIAGSIALLFGITDLIAGESMQSFRNMILGVSLPYLAILLGAVLLYVVVESAKYSYLLKISTGKCHFLASVKVNFLGKYYDGITPLGTGGQPFQIYYLHKKQLPSGVATAVPLIKYMISTMVLCVIAAVFFGFAPAFLRGSGWGNTTLYIIAWISMLCNFLIPVALLLASFFPRAGKKLVVKTVHLLSKMHIVKRKYAVTRKYVYEIDQYRAALKELLQRWWSVLPMILLCIVETTISFSLPFLAMLALASNIVVPSVHMFFELFTLSLISYYSATLVPTPGNAGAAEAATSVIFATVLVKYAGLTPLVGWIVLLWRLFSFYLYIVVGVGINIFEIIRGAVRNKKAKHEQSV